MAFAAALYQLKKELFEILLFIILLFAGLFLLINFKTYEDNVENYRTIPLPIAVAIGGILGFISGIVGIGGGIFLSPILFLLRATKPKIIVTSASVFILINSLSGIVGQLTKNQVLEQLLNYWPLLLAVLVGGQIGNFLNIKILPTKILALITSGLVLFVAARMFFKIIIN
jgi:uncharacterized membrane protein YfcA